MQFNIFHRNPYRRNTIQPPIRSGPEVASMFLCTALKSVASVSCFSSITHFFIPVVPRLQPCSWSNIQPVDSIVQRSYRDVCARSGRKKKRQSPAASYRLILPSHLRKCGNNRLGPFYACFRMMCLDQRRDVLYLRLGYIHHHQQTTFRNCLFIFLQT